MRFAVFSSSGRRYLHPEALPAQGRTFLSSFTAIAKLSFDEPPLNQQFHFSDSLQRALQGKLLLLDELPFSIEVLHTHYLHGYIGLMKSIAKLHNGYVCQRCGNDEPHEFAAFSCARCGETCTYCRKCIMMGRASECQPLVFWRGHQSIPAIQKHRNPLRWEGDLSPEQAQAAHAVANAIEQRRRQLVWAVCGSGKTELLFPGLALAFQQGLRVCIATPRVDVALELEPRLRAVFPMLSIAALYGGSKQKSEESQLIVSTAHQLLRFRDAFDVMVIDEVDAFPYSFDPMLALAVERAAKKEAAVIFLTATPNEEMKRQVKTGVLPAVKIPVRYHRRPLPVPEFVWCGNWEKRLQKRKLPNVVNHWCLQRLNRNQPFLLFVPSVSTAEQVKSILGVPAAYADDPERKEKVEKLRRGEIPAIVTTTILERGVTIPRIDVAVLGAEHNIFTESALVQIAGRVGRSAEAPDGDVAFFHFGKTKAMAAARRHIMEMNEQA